MSLSQLIDSLREEGLLVETLSSMYKCKCSQRVIKRQSVRKHLKSKRHQSYTTSDTTKLSPCDICYEEKMDFWKCPQCKNEHCLECRSNIENRKCPFCRYSSEPKIRVIDIFGFSPHIPVPPPTPRHSYNFSSYFLEYLNDHDLSFDDNVLTVQAFQ